MRNTLLRVILVATIVVGSLAAAESRAARSAEETKVALLNAFLKYQLDTLFSSKSDNLQLKYLQPDTASGTSGWGVDYRWDVNQASQPSTLPADGQPFVLSRFNSQLTIDGSYVFGDEQNHRDLSTVKLALRLERGNFGKLTVVEDSISKAFQRCLLAIPPADNPAQVAEVDREFDRCITNSRLDKALEAEPGASFFWVDLHAGVEANQNYSDNRTLFGSSAAYAYQPSSQAARGNFFDLPFRWIRESFSGRRNYVAPFPSLLLGIERLNAKDDDIRAALTSKAAFTRGHAEVSFNTLLAQIADRAVRFNVSYRYFHEFSAPDAIRKAGADEFGFVTLSLRLPGQLLPFVQTDDYEIFLSYTNGRLPFNTASDKTYELGFSTNFKALANLLSL